MRTTCHSLCLVPVLAASSVVGAELPAAPDLPPNATELGSKIQRAMTLMATSTPTQRNRVKVLFYGQSISRGPWSNEVGDYLRARYPNADLEIANHSRGGHTAPVLINCAKFDLYPFYPDLLIFHVYGGDDTGELEEIIARARRYTTADILIWTPHYRWPQGVARDGSWDDPAVVGGKKGDDHHAERLREIAGKYGCELADIRPQWLPYLEKNSLKAKDMLGDGIHPNALGQHLLAALVKPYLNYTGEQTAANWQDRVRDIPADSPEIKRTADGGLELTFEGNRVDVITAPEAAHTGSAKVFLDGKRPSEFPECYAMTPSTKMWGHYWPALRSMSWNTPLLVEDWTARVLAVDEATERVDFEVIGSKTGHDGKGNTKETFVSTSGRIVTDTRSWIFFYKAFLRKGPLPVGYEVKWSAVALSTDEYAPAPVTDKTRESVTTLVQGVPNGRHVLQLKPTGDALPALSGFRVYRPTH